ncbi:MAG: hypothetical protein AB1409_08330 [Pseudomonadota bacterium]
MDDKFLAGIVAELIEAQGVALGLVVSALASQVDAERLAQDLRKRLDAARSQKAFPPTEAKLTTHALEAALAVARLQKAH